MNKFIFLHFSTRICGFARTNTQWRKLRGAFGINLSNQLFNPLYALFASGQPRADEVDSKAINSTVELLGINS